MPKLSQNALQKRQRDMLEIAGTLNETEYIRLCAYGLYLFVVEKMRKLTPAARALLTAVTILSGGAIIATLIHFGSWPAALVIVFLLGVLVSEISRL